MPRPNRPEVSPVPTGIRSIDQLAELRDDSYTLEAYIRGASDYIKYSKGLALGPKKSAQIRLSNALGKALVADLRQICPELRDVVVGERKVSGALRTVNADVSEIHPIDGLLPRG